VCTSAMAQDEIEIQKLENSLADAFNKSDANAVSNIYAADAVLMPPNRGAIRGQSGKPSLVTDMAMLHRGRPRATWPRR
jgi:ketosteroid isomerase-like protein